MQVNADRYSSSLYQPILSPRPAGTPDARTLLEATSGGKSFGKTLDTFTSTAQGSPKSAQLPASPQAIPAPVDEIPEPLVLDAIENVEQTVEPEKPTDNAQTLSATATPPPGKPTYTQDDLDQFVASFNTSKGTEKFDERWDINGDGNINTADLSMLLANFARQRS